MRQINSSHIARHIDDNKKAAGIMNMIEKHIGKIKQVRFPIKIIKKGIKPYYKNTYGREIDIDEAIKITKEIIKVRSKYKRAEFLSYAEWALTILEKVKKDCIQYGDKIPDSSDVWEVKTIGPEIIPKKKNNRKYISVRKERQRKFCEDFKKVWE